MNKKIVVIGAGHGGLVAAALLAEKGYDVSVYERGKRGEIGYPWKDVFLKQVFPETAIEAPSEDTYAPEPAWTFVPPSEKDFITIPENPATGNVSMNRKLLVEHLVSVAERSGAKMHFASPVTDLVFDGDKVVGIKVNGEKVFADLVIDASGLLTPFREKIPGKFGLQAMPEDEGVMSVWRGSFRRREGSPDPEYKNRLFLLPDGLNGIVWCVSEDDGTVDVLIGQIGGLSAEDKEKMLGYVRKNCEIVPDEDPIEGRAAAVCVRYAMPVLVADGYVLVGDSSCLTMPVVGCGIALAMQEGHCLADYIIRGEIKSFDAVSLWKYNVHTIRALASENIGLDVLKRALLAMPKEMINDLFATHILSGELLFDVIRGSVASAFKPKTVVAVLKNLKVLIPFVKYMMPSLKSAGKAKKVAKRIPKKYDINKINAWKDKYNGFFKK